jgi:hypothetical protein
LRRFILQYRNGTDKKQRQLFQWNPGLYVAFEIYMNRQSGEDLRTGTMIEARLAAGQTSDEICHEHGTIPETIDWYEKLFFNVRDRFNAVDWMVNHVIIPAFEEAGEQTAAQNDEDKSKYPKHPIARPFLDPSVLFFAYFGGPKMVDFMITNGMRDSQAQSRDQITSWFNNFVIHTASRRSGQAALSFEINKFNVMELFSLHARLIEIQNSSDSQEQARSDMEKNVMQALSSVEFAVGEKGRKQVESTPLAQVDNQSAEARDSEVLQAAADQPPDTIQETRDLQFPAASSAQGEESSSEDAQQGS